MEWFYIDRDQKRQSFDAAALGNLVKDRTIGPETLLWNETMSDWLPAGNLFPAWFPGETVAAPAPASMEERPPTPAVPPAEFEKPEIPTLDAVPVSKSSSEPESKPVRNVVRSPAGTFDRIEMIKDFASYLNANRGWIKFFGVISIIQGSILCLSIGGALIGWLPIWLGVNVFQSAKAAELAERTGSQEYMEEALYRLGFFFKLNGIVIVVVFAFFAIVAVVLVVTGVLATLAGKVPAG